MRWLKSAELISSAVLRRHLETMDRLDIEYDFLPRESEILHLHFWDAAFQQLKEKGVLYFETEGKNKGCWVMTQAKDDRRQVRKEDHGKQDAVPTKTPRSSCVRMERSATSARTLPITFGSSACWDWTSAIASSTATQTITKSGFRPSTARAIIRTSATSRPFTTSLTRARRTRRTP